MAGGQVQTSIGLGAGDLGLHHLMYLATDGKVDAVTFGQRHHACCGLDTFGDDVDPSQSAGTDRSGSDRRVGYDVGVDAAVVERYRGRWVALDGRGNVVVDADGLGAVFEQLKVAGLSAKTVQRVPDADAPMFVGLS